MIKFCKKCRVDTERSKRGECKACISIRGKIYYAANSEKILPKVKSYYGANREDVRKKAAVRYMGNVEEERKKQAAWRSVNSAAIKKRNKINYDKSASERRAYSAQYRAANPESIKAGQDTYYALHPHARRIKSHNRKAKVRDTGGALSKDLAEKLFKLQRGLCPCCSQPLGDDYHLDHIMPIDLGGANEDWNIQLLRAGCNLQKGARHPVDFMRSRGFLV